MLCKENSIFSTDHFQLAWDIALGVPIYSKDYHQQFQCMHESFKYNLIVIFVTPQSITVLHACAFKCPKVKAMKSQAAHFDVLQLTCCTHYTILEVKRQISEPNSLVF